ncbi:hypothetical protein B0T25DRAFT_607010 [Lasiosphaeria hispida]|uniref:Amidase domain-containing protein n=1 Tax=Lasiosphaeria hispida TaxID=260671 RepID=A0AAJ0HHR0_9PEZI|nr:hypothetical protein B0T25DRAFT_607010 [Lasiosphaeria hispida]
MAATPDVLLATVAGLPCYVPATPLFKPQENLLRRPSEEKPLSGLRVVIKDVIDMAGVPTSAGIKAYGMLYGVKENNVVCVDNLLDAGAVILGGVKTVQFASGENAKDWLTISPLSTPEVTATRSRLQQCRKRHGLLRLRLDRYCPWD